MVMPAATVLRLSEIELKRRARQVRLLLTDCDGVLTDTGVYYSERGEELKRFSIRDGMGVELLRNAGIETGIISGEKSPSLVRRAEKLRISHLYLNTTNKLACLETILRETQLLRRNIAWIGDDVQDVGVLREIGNDGLSGSPFDAITIMKNEAHYVCTARGGHGAFREFADWIIGLREDGSNDE
ncbi:MAG TPA: HAD-IIIA family hydrolase [Acidobacteriota bacterium]|nr:HAD-IIIA family hydrolase [Acidobacteriota bacterium]